MAVALVIASLVLTPVLFGVLVGEVGPGLLRVIARRQRLNASRR